MNKEDKELFGKMVHDVVTAEMMVREAQNDLREANERIVVALVDRKLYNCLKPNMALIKQYSR